MDDGVCFQHAELLFDVFLLDRIKIGCIGYVACSALCFTVGSESDIFFGLNSSNEMQRPYLTSPDLKLLDHTYLESFERRRREGRCSPNV